MEKRIINLMDNECEDSSTKQKEIILEKLSKLMDSNYEMKEVLDYLCDLSIEINTRVKVIIQKQDYSNSVNLTYEKIISS